MITPRRINNLSNAPLTGGPYVQAVIHNGLVYLAGQIPWNCTTQTLFTGTVTAETQNIFQNLKVLLDACGSSLDHIIRVTAFLSKPEQAKEFSAAYAAQFTPDTLPVRTMVFVAGLPLGASIELEVTAALNG